MGNFERIDHVALVATDVERSTQWYIDVLGFERLHEGMWNGVPVFVGRGNIAVAIFPVSPDRTAQPDDAGVRLLHFALRTNREGLAAAQEHLTRRGIKFEAQDHGIARSIYIRDPDDHEIEITTYDLEERAPVP
ncbi:MAG: VOC family protein [Verrucomicrobiota bacterium]|nr:VOC family protein [Verrucomicrobiota bacterium]